jgi:hypothetical protein
MNGFLAMRLMMLDLVCDECASISGYGKHDLATNRLWDEWRSPTPNLAENSHLISISVPPITALDSTSPEPYSSIVVPLLRLVDRQATECLHSAAMKQKQRPA